MLLYILRRILYVTPVAIGVSIICFLLVHLAPGDPLTAVMPIDATAEQQAEMLSGKCCRATLDTRSRPAARC